MENRKVLKSGEFLVDEIGAKDIFIPEEFNEEQKMIAQTCQDFLETEVYPNLDSWIHPDIKLMSTHPEKGRGTGVDGDLHS